MKAKKQPIRYRCSDIPVVIDVFENKGYEQIEESIEEEDEEEEESSDSLDEGNDEGEEEDLPVGPNGWDIMWCSSKWVINYILGIKNVVRLRKEQRLNHFPNSYQLTRKDYTTLNLSRYKADLRKNGRSCFNFYPDTFLLPNDNILFRSEMKKNKDVWILKPVMGSKGEGIEIVTTYNEVESFTNKLDHKACGLDGIEKLRLTYAAQKYIPNPLLIDGKKFDLRLYVLVLSYQPLVCYAYRGGFARFSKSKFTMKDFDPMIHLTNVAIQGNDTKLDVSDIRKKLEAMHGAEKTNKLFNEIISLFLNTLQSAAKPIIQDQHCFELYGYDVLIDDNMKPWLLEINASPSMQASSLQDYDFKYTMIGETVDLAMMTRGKSVITMPPHYGGFDIIWNGPAQIIEPGSITCSNIGKPYNIKKSPNNPFK